MKQFAAPLESPNVTLIVADRSFTFKIYNQPPASENRFPVWNGAAHE